MAKIVGTRPVAGPEEIKAGRRYLDPSGRTLICTDRDRTHAKMVVEADREHEFFCRLDYWASRLKIVGDPTPQDAYSRAMDTLAKIGKRA